MFFYHSLFQPLLLPASSPPLTPPAAAYKRLILSAVHAVSIPSVPINPSIRPPVSIPVRVLPSPAPPTVAHVPPYRLLRPPTAPTDPAFPSPSRFPAASEPPSDVSRSPLASAPGPRPRPPRCTPALEPARAPGRRPSTSHSIRATARPGPATIWRPAPPRTRLRVRSQNRPTGRPCAP